MRTPVGDTRVARWSGARPCVHTTGTSATPAGPTATPEHASCRSRRRRFLERRRALVKVERDGTPAGSAVVAVVVSSGWDELGHPSFGFGLQDSVAV